MNDNGGKTPGEEPTYAIEQSKPEVSELDHPEEKDVAARFLANLSPEITDVPITDEESRRLLWKIDLIILPILAISVLMAAVDKIIISNAAIYGMVEDNNLKGNEFSWIGSIFYFGFLVAEWPGNILIQKLPIRTFYGATVFGWAVLTFMTATTSNFGGLAAVRFLSKLNNGNPRRQSMAWTRVLMTRNSGHLRSGRLSRLHRGVSHVVDRPRTAYKSIYLVQYPVLRRYRAPVLRNRSHEHGRRTLEAVVHRTWYHHHRLGRRCLHLPS